MNIVNMRGYFQIAEIAQQLIGGEIRVKRNADRTGCDRDHHYRTLCAARQHDRYSVTLAYAESS